MSSTRSSTSSNPPENGASLISNERVPSRTQQATQQREQVPRETNRNEDCFFQVSFSVSASEDCFCPYKLAASKTDQDDEKSNQLLFRKKKGANTGKQ